MPYNFNKISNIVSSMLVIIAFLAVYEPSYSQTNTLALGSLATNGGLFKEISIGYVRLTSGARVRVYMEHRTSCLGTEGAMSRWTIPILDTQLVPYDANRTLWITPYGDRVLLPEGKDVFRFRGANWKITRDRMTTSIKSNDATWTYVRGIISHCRTGDGTILNYRYDSAFEISVEEEHLSDKHTVLKRITYPKETYEELLINNTKHLLLYSPTDGRLLSWKNLNSQATCEFKYHDGLLSAISVDGKLIDTYTWEAIPHGATFNSEYNLPVYLSGDSDSEYGYEFSSGRVELSKTNSKGVETRTIDTLFHTVTNTFRCYDDKR